MSASTWVSGLRYREFAAVCALSFSVGAQAALINVTTTVDEYNATPNANCSLREAIRTANDNADFGGCTHFGQFNVENIFIPAGTYLLTRAGIDEDANSSADLDVTSSLNLNGNTAATTTIQGSAGYSGRILHILSGTVTVQNMTIRDGNLPNGRAGAGIRSEPGSTSTLSNVVVGLNVADGNAGGILNRGTMTLNSCALTNNQTLNSTVGGGGIFNSPGATLTINDSRILNNTATGNTGHGGGIYSDEGATLTIDNSTIDSNIADRASGSGGVSADGGGIHVAGGLSVSRSTISNNIAHGNSAKGGGLRLTGTPNTISGSLIFGNHAARNPDLTDDVTAGGGIAAVIVNGNMNLTIFDSIIAANVAESGGGGGIDTFLQVNLTIGRTTISGNRATGSFIASGVEGFGGGLRLGTSTSLILVDSTISGNEADSGGGGMQTSGEAMLIGSSVVNNTSNADGVSGGAGGGLFVVSLGGNVVSVRNSVLAGNLENNIGDHDDCDGILLFEGNNLIGNTSGCTTLMSGGTDKLNTPAQLGALADNGGPPVGASNATVFAAMLTHLPLSTSPLVDAGRAQGCTDQNGVLLAVDQRGFPRHVDGPDPGTVATCDIGATEFGAVPQLPDPVFADGFE